MDLRPLISPRSIAIVGASEEPDSWAPTLFGTLREFGFTGPVVPVNPKHSTVWGMRCLPSLAGVSPTPDLAILTVPARMAATALDDVGRAGGRAAMVIASGFAETGAEGAALQDELVRIAGEYGIALLGPNVEGFFNYPDRVGMYAADLPPDRVAGGLTVISHSGAVVWYLAQQASDRAVGLRLAVGVGNGAMLDAGDFLTWAADDRQTSVVACYLEANRNLESLERGLRAACLARKPVIMCAPGGRSDPVRRSIAAHTGTLAPDSGRRDAWLRANGALLVEDAAELFEAAVLLLRYQHVRAPGVTGAMEAGGDATLFAASAERAGLRIAPFTAGTEERLRRILPDFANPTSPLDVTGQCAFDSAAYSAVLDTLVADPGIGVIALDAAPPRGREEAYWAAPTLKHAATLVEETDIAVVSVLASPLAYSPGAKRYVANSPIPFLHGHRAGARAVQALLEFQDGREDRNATGTADQRRAVQRLLEHQAGVLDQYTAGRILAAYGIASPDEALVDTPDEAASASAGMGYPVAVKAVSAQLPHKSPAGAVSLHLCSARAVRDAAEAVRSAAALVAGGPVKVLVQKMVSGTEILVGAIVDECYGPMVTLRPGGQLVASGTERFHAAPLPITRARAIVSEEAQACGLIGHPARQDHVAGALAAMSSLIGDFRSRLSEVEASPLIVGEESALAVDALAVVQAAAVTARGSQPGTPYPPARTRSGAGNG
jgi:acetate---CoA ligase (ADP-forming)